MFFFQINVPQLYYLDHLCAKIIKIGKYFTRVCQEKKFLAFSETRCMLVWETAAWGNSAPKVVKSGANSSPGENDVKTRIDGTVTEHHQHADGLAARPAVPIVGVDAYRTDDHVRCETDYEAGGD